MPIQYQDWINREDVQANPEWYYVFGDNLQRVGLGGQAKAMRGEPNAIGVATKRRPDNDLQSFFYERDKEDVIAIVERDIQKIETVLKKGATVVIPSDGLGTGLSRLPEFAPSVDQYIKDRIAQLERTYNV